MAIDYGIQNLQVQPAQQPNMLQQIMLFNQVNEARRETDERNALRAMLRAPDADLTNPDFQRRLLSVAPKTAPGIITANARVNADMRAGEKSTRDAGLSDEQRKVAAAARFRDELPGVLTSADPAGAWKAWRGRFASAMGETNLPEEYPGPEAVRGVMMNASQMIEAAKKRFQDVGGVPHIVDDSGDLREPRVIPAQPGGPVPGMGRPQADVTGVPSYPVNPARVAAMARAAQTYAPDLVQNDAGPVASMPAEPPMPPVRPNAMAAPVAAPVANAMNPAFGALPSAVTTARPGGRPASEVIAEKQTADQLQKIEQTRLETQARGEAKAGVERAEKARDKDVGKEQFSKTFDRFVEQYKEMGRQGTLITENTPAGQRIKTFAAAQAPGVAGVIDPKMAAPIQTLQNLRQAMVASLIAANPGMSSKSIDSNAELKSYLDSLTTPGQSVATIVDTMNALSEKYGSGKQIKVEDITGPAKATNRAPSGRGAAAAPAGPSVDDLLEKYK